MLGLTEKKNSGGKNRMADNIFYWGAGFFYLNTDYICRTTSKRPHSCLGDLRCEGWRCRGS